MWVVVRVRTGVANGVNVGSRLGLVGVVISPIMASFFCFFRGAGLEPESADEEEVLESLVTSRMTCGGATSVGIPRKRSLVGAGMLASDVGIGNGPSPCIAALDTPEGRRSCNTEQRGVMIK